MKAFLRTTLTAGVLLGIVLLAALPAWSHASLSASQPARGAAVEEPPTQVTLSFTEPPDPALTSVTVVGGSGSFEDGPPRVSPDNNLMVQVDLKDLPNGSYTVSWRTVSAVDGHSTSGSFAFGVGEPPDPASAADMEEETTSKLPSAVARWVLYLGLSALLGAAWVSRFAFTERMLPLQRLAKAGWILALAGVAGLAVTQFNEAGVDLGIFFSSTSGRGLTLRAVPVVLAGLALFVLRNKHRTQMLAAGALTLLAMLAHSATGHAAVPPGVGLKVTQQWVHFAAVGVWLGGLAALLIGIRQTGHEERQRAAKRFSFVAGIAILVVVLTGILRAIQEVGGWEPLFNSSYGRLVIAKSALIVALGGLGALNRFRNVPVAGSAPDKLQKAGRLEVAVAVVTLALAGMLSTSVPPISMAAQSEESRVAVTGTDFARTVEATLVVEPGTGGPNRFSLDLTEPGSDDPLIGVEGVILRFSSPSNPAGGESTLELSPNDDGRFVGTGSNVSSDGRWRAVVAIRTSSDSLEIPLEFSTRAPGHITSESVVEGQPTIYSVTDPQGRQLQVYGEPDTPGRSELHFTLFDEMGTEQEVDEIMAIAASPDESAVTLLTRRFGPGHFVSDVTLEEGINLFDVVLRSGDESIRFSVEMRTS